MTHVERETLFGVPLEPAQFARVMEDFQSEMFTAEEIRERNRARQEQPPDPGMIIEI